ncbi:MAG TPA: hypothetical protein VMW27_23570 [Thermoanaerobaculia bacterium]|nr:hypothetical protein [Thermoanaerobaculia bacterium]
MKPRIRGISIIEQLHLAPRSTTWYLALIALALIVSAAPPATAATAIRPASGVPVLLIGRILNAHGEPLGGVGVRVEKTALSTVTDLEGWFQIDLSSLTDFPGWISLELVHEEYEPGVITLSRADLREEQIIFMIKDREPLGEILILTDEQTDQPL